MPRKDLTKDFINGYIMGMKHFSIKIIAELRAQRTDDQDYPVRMAIWNTWKLIKERAEKEEVAIRERFKATLKIKKENMSRRELDSLKDACVLLENIRDEKAQKTLSGLRSIIDKFQIKK